jgi:WD40 repeat protein
VAAAGDDGFFRLWNISDGKSLLTMESPGAPKDLCLADLGQRAIVALGDGTVCGYVLEANGDDVRADLIHEGRSSNQPTIAMALAQDERMLFTVSADRTVRHWLAASAPPRRELSEHRGPVYAVRFSPDSTRIATAGADGMLRLWDLQEGVPLYEIEHGYPVLDVSFRPDGNRLVTAGLKPVIRLLDSDARPVKRFTQGLEDAVYSVHFHPSGSYVLSGGGGRHWQMWAESSDTPVRQCPGHNGTIRRAVWNQKAGRVASVDDLGELFIWDTGGRPLYHQRLSAGAAHCLAYTPDGSQLVIGTQDSRLILLTLPENSR